MYKYPRSYFQKTATKYQSPQIPSDDVEKEDDIL